MCLSESTILIPFSGIKYVRTVIKSQTEDLQPELKQNWIPQRLQENDRIHRDIDDDCKCFAKLVSLLLKFENCPNFHAVLYTHSAGCMVSIETLLSNHPSLSWLTVTKQCTKSGDRRYRMSKTEREKHVRTFVKSEKALLILTGAYRDVSNDGVDINAVYFYGVPKAKHNEYSLPDRVFTIAHDLM